MKIRLGYACISNILNITSSSTITLTYYKKLDTISKKNKLNTIIKNNLSNLESLIKYNIKNNFHFFRITSKLIPLMDIENIDLNIFKKDFINIGNLIKKHNLRVDVHVDEYCVLNSINDNVVKNSIIILTNLVKVIDMFKINYHIIMHIGSKQGGIYNSSKRFITNFNLLPKTIQNKMILENDDKSFNAYQTLKICKKLNIPMCLDIHHHNCNKCTKPIDYYLKDILNTYKDFTPKVHFSSSKSKKEFRSHNDYINSIDFINFLNLLNKYNKDIDIMLEAKNKDLALVKLMYELKYKENYKFIDESSFKI